MPYPHCNPRTAYNHTCIYACSTVACARHPTYSYCFHGYSHSGTCSSIATPANAICQSCTLQLANPVDCNLQIPDTALYKCCGLQLVNLEDCTAGMAAEDLALAARYCQRCSQHRGHLQAVWKLMGDVHLQFHAATPPVQVGAHTHHPELPFPPQTPSI